MSVKQYPYYLYVHQVTGSSQDENGDFVQGTESWVFHSMCREETNGKGAEVRTEDGDNIIFSSVMYLPKGTTEITAGTEVTVSNIESSESEIRIKGDVLKFDKGQLNCRLWV